MSHYTPLRPKAASRMNTHHPLLTTPQQVIDTVLDCTVHIGS